jgi:hypothetical protein
MQRQREHTLVVTDGPIVGERYLLYEMVSTFGRTSDNTIVLDSSQVSRHHAQIRLTPGGAVIEDMGSTNGTWINNQRLVEPHTLSPGDRIRFADYVTVEYVVQESPSTERLDLTGSPQSTKVMGEAFDFESVPAPQPAFVDPDVVEPYTPPGQAQPAYEPVPAASPVVDYGAPLSYGDSPVTPFEEAPAARRPRWLYAVIGVLVVLICLCVALAVYLWFATASFWEQVFDFLGIPLPAGFIVGHIVSLF